MNFTHVTQHIRGIHRVALPGDLLEEVISQRAVWKRACDIDGHDGDDKSPGRYYTSSTPNNHSQTAFDGGSNGVAELERSHRPRTYSQTFRQYQRTPRLACIFIREERVSRVS